MNFYRKIFLNIFGPFLDNKLQTGEFYFTKDIKLFLKYLTVLNLLHNLKLNFFQIKT